MRHHSLHHLFQRSKTPLKLPWSSCPVAVNPLGKYRFLYNTINNHWDLAVSLIWSQHRPLALFHQNQEIHGDEPLVAPKIPAKPCKTSFVWPEKIQQKLNFLKTNSSNELLFQTTLWPLLPYYFERKLLFYPTLGTPFYSPILYDFYQERQATSVKRKRRLKMNKHKYKKRRDRQRALRKRLGK